MTKKMIVGALEATSAGAATVQTQKFSYDTQSDWELSRLLSALDDKALEAEILRDYPGLAEIRQLSDTLIGVLEAKTESAEVFIQLSERVLKRNDYERFDKLVDILGSRFSAAEIAEIIRQTDLAQIRAAAFETLSMLPTAKLAALLDDSLYFDIARNALEQQAFEYDSEEAREVLEQLFFGTDE